MHRAVESRAFKLAEYLLTYGADVNIQDEVILLDLIEYVSRYSQEGRTALHRANFKFCQLLLKNGADVNMQDHVIFAISPSILDRLD